MQTRLDFVIEKLEPHIESRDQARDAIIAQKGEDAWFNNPDPKHDYAALRKELEEEESELYKAIEQLTKLDSLESDPEAEEKVARAFFNQQSALLRGISEVKLLGRVFNDWQKGQDQPKRVFFRVLYQLSDRGAMRVCRVIQNTTLVWAEHGTAFAHVASVPRASSAVADTPAGAVSGGRGGGAVGRGGYVSRGSSNHPSSSSRTQFRHKEGRGGHASRGGFAAEGRGGRVVPTSRQPPPLPSVFLVDSIGACKHAVSEILTHRLVSVDLEGIELCRSGEICIIQVALPNHRVFLFDICALRADAFEAGGLRDVLSGPSPLKLMYDCRADADALFHQYHIQLHGVYDLQVALVKSRMQLAKKLPGLAVCICRCCGDASPEAESFKLGKDKGAGLWHAIACCFALPLIVSLSAMFAPDQGGSYEVWRARPLHPQLLSYCAQDVSMLFCCYEKLRHFPNGAEAGVVAIASQRIELAIRDARPSRGAHKSDRDFQ